MQTDRERERERERGGRAKAVKFFMYLRITSYNLFSLLKRNNDSFFVIHFADLFLVIICGIC